MTKEKMLFEYSDGYVHKFSIHITSSSWKKMCDTYPCLKNVWFSFLNRPSTINIVRRTNLLFYQD